MPVTTLSIPSISNYLLQEYSLCRMQPDLKVE